MANADRLIELFTEAKAWTAGAEREQFLAEACLGDPELKEQVVSLLQSHEGVGDFLKNTILSPTLVVTEKPGDMIGRYKLLEKLGEGGCGVVYVAEQTEPVRRRVAIKVIKLSLDTKQVVARFEAERQALAMMDHPNIAKVFDAGATDAPLPLSDSRPSPLAPASGRPYFVMELVRGVRITDYCDQNNLSTKERLDLFIKVCQALQHAHQKGIIHRDIKPSNILVTLHDGVPVPKVIDFGIAKATEGRLTDATVYTQLHHFIGTPAYMSPEQAEMSGLDIDTRSDIYSLGVLLYELLTGKTPFDAQRLMASGLDAMRKTIRETEPVRPSTRLTEEFAEIDSTLRKTVAGLAIPSESEAAAESRAKLRLKEQINRVRGDLDWIVMKCLEKDRTRRYETANGLAAEINRHLNDEPVIARPPSAAYKFQKAWRRNKLVFTAAAAVAIALLAGIGLSAWKSFEASRARDAAQTERDKARTAEKAEKQALLQEVAEKNIAEYNLYVANINRAGQAWEENNLEQLRQLLDATRNFPQRGFEWYYWQRQAHLQLTTFRGLVDLGRSAAFSPDGQRVVTGSDDHTARVWDAASGRELFKLIGHSAAINSAAFSPDGKLIVTGSSDQAATVWDATNQRELFKHIGHNAGISCAAFSPDSLRIVTASYDGTAKVWEATSGREPITFQGNMSSVLCAAFSPDGKRIVTGSADTLARLWDVATGAELLQFKGHSRQVRSVTFSRDGQRVLTGSSDQTARVWDALTGEELFKLRGPSTIVSVDFSRDGQRIVTGSYDSTATVWDAVNRDRLFTIRADAKAVTSVAFSPDGQRIVTSGGSGIGKIWDASGARESLLLQGYSSSVTTPTNGILAVAISPDGQRVVTGGGPYNDSATAFGIGEQPAQVWESASGKKMFTLNGHTSAISAVAFSLNGEWIVTGSGDKTVRVWKAATGEPVRKLEGHKGVVNSVAFSSDSQRIVTGADDRTAKVWDTATGRKVFDLAGHTAPVRSVACSPDGRWIATGSLDHTVRLWEAATGRLQRTLEWRELNRVFSVVFSPDSQRLVAGGWPRVAIIWNVATSKKVGELIGHLAPLSSVAFSGDGRRIVTGSWDRSAKVWDANTGQQLLTLNGKGVGVSAVAFSEDGQQIVTGDWNGTARVWKVARTDQVDAWAAEEQAALDSQERWQKELAALLRENADEQRRQRVALTRADPGAIKQWLVLMPIALAFDINRAQELELEQIQNEARLKPKAGEKVLLGTNELKWQRVAGEDYAIDFNALSGQDIPQSVIYAVCYIRSEREQCGLQILLGADDGAKLYLNEKQIHKPWFRRSFAPDQEKVPDISLNAGLNVLVFKLMNDSPEAQGSIRLTDAQGNPVPGIQVTLDPDSKYAP